LHAQRLTTPLGAEPAPTLDALYNVIEQMGCVQIDTLQMVQRSQYIALWSRIGTYDPADVDRVAFGESTNLRGLGAPGGFGRRLFEYWFHAACLIPLTQYRYRLPAMRWHRESGSSWRHEWMQKPENVAL